jgi:serine/threonine protein phosphatase PrpC
MTIRVCATCGEAAPAAARFCEACGAALAPADPAAPVPDPAGTAGTCVGCGAPATAIGADGYCGHCGMLQRDPRDHREEEAGSIAAVTDRGLHHHRNEDSFAIAQVDVDGVLVRIAVVCDGVSSTADSHLASQAAADAARGVLRAAAPGVVHARGDAARLRTATGDAIAAAQSAARAIPARGGETPSSTIVAVTVVPTDTKELLVVVGWLGDSRAYSIVGGELQPISTDDSWAAEQIAAGMAEQDAYVAPQAHTITRWIGADAVDVEPHIDTRVLPEDATVLVCSDGLWNYAPTVPELAQVIAARAQPPGNLARAQALTNFARDAGGHDNITVAIITT